MIIHITNSICDLITRSANSYHCTTSTIFTSIVHVHKKISIYCPMRIRREATYERGGRTKKDQTKARGTRTIQESGGATPPSPARWKAFGDRGGGRGRWQEANKSEHDALNTSQPTRFSGKQKVRHATHLLFNPNSDSVTEEKTQSRDAAMAPRRTGLFGSWLTMPHFA